MKELSVVVKEEPALIGPAKFSIGFSEGMTPDKAVFLLFAGAVRLLIGGISPGKDAPKDSTTP